MAHPPMKAKLVPVLVLVLVLVQVLFLVLVHSLSKAPRDAQRPPRGSQMLPEISQRVLEAPKVSQRFQ